MERKCQLGFNSAITAVSEEDGSFSDKLHVKRILPLRGRSMQIDGVAGVFIARYGMEVTYFDEIVNADEIVRRVQQAIDGLLGVSTEKANELFPLRGAKWPTVTLEKPAPRKPTYRKMVVAELPSDITRYTKSSEEWKQFEQHVCGSLVNLDGARGCKINYREVGLIFDTRFTSKTAVQRHLRRELVGLREERAILPFLKHKVLRLKFTVVDM